MSTTSSRPSFPPTAAPSQPPQPSPPASQKEPSTRVPSYTDPEEDEYDDAYEKKIVRKLDLYIIPLVMLLYLFSFLDR